jgi:hypothetical protein
MRAVAGTGRVGFRSSGSGQSSGWLAAGGGVDRDVVDGPLDPAQLDLLFDGVVVGGVAADEGEQPGLRVGVV